MALTWDITQVRDGKELYELAGQGNTGQQLYKLNVVSETVIWFTILVDMGSITEQNAAEFYTRVHLYEKLFEPMISSIGPEPEREFKRIYLLPEDIHRHIGLRTNVTTKTMAAFVRKIVNGSGHATAAKQYEREYRELEKKIAEAEVAAKEAVEVTVEVDA